MKIDVTFEATDTTLQVSFDDKLQLVSSGILNDADKVIDGTVSGAYASSAVIGLRENAFVMCVNLSAISLPNCTNLGAQAFRGCTALESVNLPNCTSFTNGISTGYYFDANNKLKTINIPNLTTIETGTRSFGGCYELEEFNAPNLASLTTTTSMFTTCRKLKKLNLPKLGGTTINARTFENCYALEKVILGGSQLNPLDNVSAFSNAGALIENGVNIYVPDDLVDTYKTATNWSNFADKIKPISELEE